MSNTHSHHLMPLIPVEEEMASTSGARSSQQDLWSGHHNYQHRLFRPLQLQITPAAAVNRVQHFAVVQVIGSARWYDKIRYDTWKWFAYYSREAYIATLEWKAHTPPRPLWILYNLQSNHCCPTRIWLYLSTATSIFNILLWTYFQHYKQILILKVSNKQHLFSPHFIVDCRAGRPLRRGRVRGGRDAADATPNQETSCTGFRRRRGRVGSSRGRRHSAHIDKPLRSSTRTWNRTGHPSCSVRATSCI